MKADKGMKGYRKARRKRLIIWVSILGLAIIAQLAARNFTGSAAAKNILTVMAVLTVLPLANFASPLLAAWKYRQPDEDFYQEMAPYEEKTVILYELIITSKDFIMPADAIVIHPQGIIIYCTNEKTAARKAEHFAAEMLSGNKLDLGIRVINNRNAFIRRLENLKPASEYEDNGGVNYAISLLKSLSM